MNVYYRFKCINGFKLARATQRMTCVEPFIQTLPVHMGPHTVFGGVYVDQSLVFNVVLCVLVYVC